MRAVGVSRSSKGDCGLALRNKRAQDEFVSDHDRVVEVDAVGHAQLSRADRARRSPDVAFASEVGPPDGGARTVGVDIEPGELVVARGSRIHGVGYHLGHSAVGGDGHDRQAGPFGSVLHPLSSPDSCSVVGPGEVYEVTVLHSGDQVDRRGARIVEIEQPNAVAVHTEIFGVTQGQRRRVGAHRNRVNQRVLRY